MARGADVVGVAVTCWELRVLRVIECRARPRSGVVAVLARGREELWLRRMARIRGVVVISLMTANASRRQSRVIPVHMAISALPRRRSMRSSQGEGRVVVVER